MGTEGEDPIFQAEERETRATPRAALLFQFFLFPLLVVVAAVGVFLFFGAIGGSDKSPNEWLDVVVTGGTNERKQAAHQLGVALQRERSRVDRGEIKLQDAFYVKDERFRERLASAITFPPTADTNDEHQVFLIVAAGFVGDPTYLPILDAQLTGKASEDRRRALAQSIGRLDTPKIVPVLARLAKDPDEPVRNYAVQGISNQPGPDSVDALKTFLSDEALFVRASAASALALQGDSSGQDLVAQQLDPTWVDQAVRAPSGTAEKGTSPPAGQADAMRAALLMNGLRGAFHLKSEDLRPKVEALKEDRDENVRRLARDVLDQWPISR